MHSGLLNPLMEKRDVVIGVVTGLSWAELRPYAVSLSRCGFEGDKVLLVNNLADDVRANLTRLGFILVDYELHEKLKDCNAQSNVNAWTYFGKYRWYVASAFLKENLDKYRYVIWTDVRDLMFQTDPSEWLNDLPEPFAIVASKECWLIKDQPHNNQWAIFTTAGSEEDYMWLREQEVLCSGCVAGKAATMIELFDAIFEFSEKADPRANDQGIFNYVVRKPPFRDVTMVPFMEAGFIATGGARKRYEQHAYTTDDAPIFDISEYVVSTPIAKEPFCIVHQYDRDPNWKFCIEQIMKAADELP